MRAVASPTPGEVTFSEGTSVRPCSSASSVSCGYSLARSSMMSANCGEQTLMTKSPAAIRLSKLCLVAKSEALRPKAMPTSGGSPVIGR